jgi:hypothetical protein
MHEHYLKGGYTNVQIRDSVNLWASDAKDEPFPDIESMFIEALYEHAGVTRDDWVVDVGSGYPPYFLRLLKLNGHSEGKLVGVEPNISEESQARFSAEDFGGIHVVRGLAEAAPLKRHSVKVETALRSLYHLSDAEITKYFDGLDWALQPEGGIAAAWLRGERYKENFGQTEVDVCGPLSDMMGSVVSGPQRINAGLTTEKALPLYMERFKYVAELRQFGKMKYAGTIAIDMVLRAHLTLTDRYTDEYGRNPTPRQHLAALRSCLREHMTAVTDGDAVMVDTFDQSFIIASNAPLNLPDSWVPVGDLSGRKP